MRSDLIDMGSEKGVGARAHSIEWVQRRGLGQGHTQLNGFREGVGQGHTKLSWVQIKGWGQWHTQLNGFRDGYGGRGTLN
ncbi:hypothetical protein DPMN_069050 [Dreissena polymorpha]|uniref:Uncharacterized protein n=1 Tax=Dreissena polymorpha TaxID=45954 RepID=A0A9D3Z2A6_DREPO|nr:hypothetical protein DPMN_069050 [Dreissena polymorpha]